MIGWEFPPAKTGGLGTHCYELVNNLGAKCVNVILLIPKRTQNIKHNIKNVEIIEIGSVPILPYNTTKESTVTFEKGYGWNFFKEVEIFNKKCVETALRRKNDFDIIHCHDWISVNAGIEIKKRTGKPLVFTIHSTEYDRTANIYPLDSIIEIEKRGIQEADVIITVSKSMKKQLIERYGADERKIRVIYNGINVSRYFGFNNKDRKNIVLFLGRLTNQKGPWFFLHTAKKVLERKKDVIFVIAGHGDKLAELIKLSIDLGIGDHILFTGYLTEEEINYAYAMAKVYVMPSVAEPYGITALEAIASGTPVIVSKNAGVAEEIKHCFKVDFWDTHEMASKIIGILNYPVLEECMRRNSYNEVKNLSWERTANQTIEVYRSLI
ncbi:MAG: glycosyltransferase family 4 protein [Candidatus Aenigmatarchaeota archaeon]